MNKLFMLPFRGDPMSDESLMGFVLRMGNRNGLDGFYWLYKQLSRDKLNHLK